jgi:hypothetical protein
MILKAEMEEISGVRVRNEAHMMATCKNGTIDQY